MTISILVDKVGAAPVWTGSQTRGMFSSLFAGKTAARPLGARSGVAHNTPTNTITVSGTTYTIKPHAGVLDVESSTTAGPYPYVNDADVTGSHAAAHATNARKDLLSIRLDDPAAGDGTSVPLAAFVCTKGAEDGSNVAPATPARSMPLAWINVPASGGGASTITWVAPYMQGGVVPVRNATERAALYTAYPATTECPVIVWQVDIKRLLISTDGVNWKDGAGRFIWADATARGAATGAASGDYGVQLDTALIYRHNGTAWKAWESDFVAYSATLSNVTLGTGYVTSYKWRYIAGLVEVEASIKLGTGGVMGNFPNITLPVNHTALIQAYQVYNSASSYYDASNVDSIPFNGVIAANGTDVDKVRFYLTNTGALTNITNTNPMTWAVNDTLHARFTYVPA